jgi:hypothetical protein
VSTSVEQPRVLPVSRGARLRIRRVGAAAHSRSPIVLSRFDHPCMAATMPFIDAATWISCGGVGLQQRSRDAAKSANTFGYMSSDNARDPAAGERWQQAAVELVRGELGSPPGLGPRIAIYGQGRLYIAASAISRVLLGGPATVPAPRVTASRALPLPSNHTCTSRHAFPIRVRRFPGVTHSSAIAPSPAGARRSTSTRRAGPG